MVQARLWLCGVRRGGGPRGETNMKIISLVDVSRECKQERIEKKELISLPVIAFLVCSFERESNLDESRTNEVIR